jgi:ELWxxDGT repeat protein
VLYFFGRDDHGMQLWKSNGTPGGTVRVTNMNAASGGLRDVGGLVAAGGALYFSAADGDTASSGAPTAPWRERRRSRTHAIRSFP